jgi:hypothetical protein
MKILVVFIAGTMFLSTAFAADPGFEARFQMKTGRRLPAAETHRHTPAQSAMNCAGHECCRHSEPTVANTAAPSADPGAEARFQMKFGQHSPSVRLAAAGQSVSQPLPAASARLCEAGCCAHGE